LKHKRAIIVLAILAVVVLLAVFLLPRLLTRNHDLRSALASALQVSAERQKDFFINLPPADARFPGSILATSKFLVLDRSDANNPDIHPGGTFQLSTDDAVAASALGSLSVPALQEAAENKQAITLELKIANGKVLEMDVPQLKHRLLESQAAGDAANKGTDPLVITRAYSGQLTFLLHRRSKESVDLWNRLIRSSSASKDDHLSISADRASAGELSVEIRDPVIFAFEVSTASFITSHLGAEPTDVQFRPIRPADLPAEPHASKSAAVPWILATIASGHYPALQTLRQDWNAASASLMQKTLGEYAPTKVHTLAATEEKPLSESAIKTFMADLGKDTHDNGRPLVIGYYIGHVVTWPSGDIALILGDATSIPRFSTTPSKAAIDEGLGKNIGDLARLADALTANVEKLPEGFLPLRELYSGFEQLGVPFALIIDGCLRMDEFERSREALHIVSDPSGTSFFYIGPDDQQTSALSQLGTLLTHVADNQPFLHRQSRYTRRQAWHLCIRRDKSGSFVGRSRADGCPDHEFLPRFAV
jgi:hypothetical protein